MFIAFCQCGPDEITVYKDSEANPEKGDGLDFLWSYEIQGTIKVCPGRSTPCSALGNARLQPAGKSNLAVKSKVDGTFHLHIPYLTPPAVELWWNQTKIVGPETFRKRHVNIFVYPTVEDPTLVIFETSCETSNRCQPSEKKVSALNPRGQLRTESGEPLAGVYITFWYKFLYPGRNDEYPWQTSVGLSQPDGLFYLPPIHGDPPPQNYYATLEIQPPAQRHSQDLPGWVKDRYLPWGPIPLEKSCHFLDVILLHHQL